MTRSINILSLSFLFMMSFNLYAVIQPETELGAEKYDRTMCITRHADYCISTVCIKSEERDCQDRCRQLAEDKCLEKMGDDTMVSP